ncbi:MAG: hypothetical protein JW783_02660 [Bacteroidales bacterium]|nr:hypothetical protein [Bacteroidales bacterium]MBN2748209.1 hypothetical protein [Bacteroidales bacterium]
MKNLENLTILEINELVKIAGGHTAELAETNWWYCSNEKPCDTTDVLGCSNSKAQLMGCK